MVNKKVFLVFNYLILIVNQSLIFFYVDNTYFIQRFVYQFHYNTIHFFIIIFVIHDTNYYYSHHDLCIIIKLLIYLSLCNLLA